jgi:ABC-type uncharacterized transport system permease subunit
MNVSEFGDWLTIMAKLIIAGISGLLMALPIVALTQITSMEWKVITTVLLAYLLPTLFSFLLNPSSINLFFISAR